MKIIFLLFLALIALKAEDFISVKEYSKMLYENPRGVACNKCHGNKGESTILGSYDKNGKKEVFVVPSIQNLEYKDFKKSLEETKSARSIMPTYSLTENEIISLYNYIKELNKENANAKK